jgi:hypothetical protein
LEDADVDDDSLLEEDSMRWVQWLYNWWVAKSLSNMLSDNV